MPLSNLNGTPRTLVIMVLVTVVEPDTALAGVIPAVILHRHSRGHCRVVGRRR
jgi:hypothetical protein